MTIFKMCGTQLVQLLTYGGGGGGVMPNFKDQSFKINQNMK